MHNSDLFYSKSSLSADIDNPPKEGEVRKEFQNNLVISIGDLHGNALLLLYSFLREGIFFLKNIKTDYEIFKNVYNKAGDVESILKGKEKYHGFGFFPSVQAPSGIAPKNFPQIKLKEIIKDFMKTTWIFKGINPGKNLSCIIDGCQYDKLLPCKAAFIVSLYKDAEAKHISWQEAFNIAHHTLQELVKKNAFFDSSEFFHLRSSETKKKYENTYEKMNAITKIQAPPEVRSVYQYK